MKPKVLLADDHELFLEGLERLLRPEFEVVGAVLDGRRLVELTAQLQPDVVVTDMTMPLLNGIDAARQIKKVNPNIRIVLLTMHLDLIYAREAFEAGVSAYALKHSPGPELVKAIRESLAGRTYISPLIDQNMLNTLRRGTRRSGTPLSPRQREVLQLVAEGRSSKEIAGLMSISRRTVEFHKTVAMEKVGAHSTCELIKYAVRHGLVG